MVSPERESDADGTWPLFHPANVRGAVALVVVIGGGLSAVLVWFHPVTVGESRLDPAIMLTPTFALVSGVVGHYFGARGADRAEARARVVEREKEVEEDEKLQALTAGEAMTREHEALLLAAAQDPELGEKLEAVLRRMKDVEQE